MRPFELRHDPFHDRYANPRIPQTWGHEVAFLQGGPSFLYPKSGPTERGAPPIHLAVSDDSGFVHAPGFFGAKQAVLMPGGKARHPNVRLFSVFPCGSVEKQRTELPHRSTLLDALYRIDPLKYPIEQTTLRASCPMLKALVSVVDMFARPHWFWWPDAGDLVAGAMNLAGQAEAGRNILLGTGRWLTQQLSDVFFLPAPPTGPDLGEYIGFLRAAEDRVHAALALRAATATDRDWERVLELEFFAKAADHFLRAAQCPPTALAGRLLALPLVASYSLAFGR